MTETSIERVERAVDGQLQHLRGSLLKATGPLTEAEAYAFLRAAYGRGYSDALAKYGTTGGRPHERTVATKLASSLRARVVVAQRNTRDRRRT